MVDTLSKVGMELHTSQIHTNEVSKIDPGGFYHRLFQEDLSWER